MGYLYPLKCLTMSLSGVNDIIHMERRLVGGRFSDEMTNLTSKGWIMWMTVFWGVGFLLLERSERTTTTEFDLDSSPHLSDRVQVCLLLFSLYVYI